MDFFTIPGDILLNLKGHGGPAYKCRFFPSGIVVISIGADGSSRIWSAESGVNPVVLKGHTMAAMDVAIVDKGRNVITVSRYIDWCRIALLSLFRFFVKV